MDEFLTVQFSSTSTYLPPIIVYGWLGGTSTGGGGGGGSWDTSNLNDRDYQDSGTTNPNCVQTLNHFYTCGTDDGAAVQIAQTIMSTTSVYGPTLYDWQRHEYSALVAKTAAGSYTALDSTIYTKGLVDQSSVPTPDGSTLIAGLVHNHPDALGNDQSDLKQRYPSDRDWQALETLRGIFGGANPGYDPSLDH